MDTGRRRAARPGDPFAALGLPPGPGLTDDDVRAAWRRVAAAAHPDRADGGDPARFAEAAAAYTTLRTAFGRTEALADLAGPRGGRPGQLAGRLRSRRNARRGQAGRAGERGGGPGHGDGRAADGQAGGGAADGQADGGSGRAAGRVAAGRPGLALARFWSRVRRGRPGRLALRVCAAVAVSGGAALVAGTGPATPALTTGALTWLALTARSDLAPPG